MSELRRPADELPQPLPAEIPQQKQTLDEQPATAQPERVRPPEPQEQQERAAVIDGEPAIGPAAADGRNPAVTDTTHTATGEVAPDADGDPPIGAPIATDAHTAIERHPQHVDGEPAITRPAAHDLTTSRHELTPATPAHPSSTHGDINDGERATAAGETAPPADDTPRWATDDLTPTGTHGKTIGGELYRDANGDMHFVGDRVGTWRDSHGRLHDANGFATDDNKPPPTDVQAPAVVDNSRTIPSDGPEPTAAAVRQAITDRDTAAAAKDTVWRQEVDPVPDALRSAGVTVDRNTFGSEAVERTLDQAMAKLTRAESIQARAASAAYAEASANLVRASERLGVAGGNHAVAVAFPTAKLVSGGDDTRGSPGTLDRVVYVDGSTPLVVVVEDKGAGSSRGTRNVPDPANPATTIKAEQCSPEYVHALLSIDPKLAQALRDDPGLRVVMQRTVHGTDGGQIKCFLAHTSARGIVTLTEYRLDSHRLRRENIQLATTERRRT